MQCLILELVIPLFLIYVLRSYASGYMNCHMIDVCVSSPMGAKVVTHKACLNCVIQYEQVSDTTDLICLPFKGIDVIMGLNWLTANNIMIDCGNKTLVVSRGMKSDGVEASMNFISIAQAERSLRKGCKGFIVFFSVQAEAEVRLNDIPVVQEFPDVFPDDISGLPPEREVEFSIELVPSTRPIAKAPYRMAPNEMTELKKQLEELLKKGFIRDRKSVV